MYGRHEKKITSTKNAFEKRDKRRPITPPSADIQPKPIEQSLPKIPIGQVVLDKFGNFRLASNEKSIELTSATHGLSRSRSRRKYSSGTRSRSRSLKRRFRSRSHDRRRYSPRSYRSRSASRPNSYSRSRSRSVSVERHRSRYRGRGNHDRGTYYKPRFGSTRFSGRGNRGGFHDSRDNRGRGRDNWHRSSWNNRGGTNRYRRDENRDRRVDRRSKSLNKNIQRKDSIEQNDLELKIKSPFQSVKSSLIEDWDENIVVNKEDIKIDVVQMKEI